MWPPRISNHEKSCVNCGWFIFNPKRVDNFGNPVRMNRECVSPEKIVLKHGVCQQWKDTRTLKQKLKGDYVRKSFC